MKSRLARAAVRRVAPGLSAPTARSSAVCANHSGRPRRAWAAAATAPSTSGHAVPALSAQPTAMQTNTATWDDVVAPVVEHRPDARLLELQPGQLAVAAVEHRVREQEQRARDLERRRRAEEKGAPASPSATLVSVIILGVTGVVTRRRVMASEMRRSK